MAMHSCPRCGALVAPDAAFCTKCGLAVVPAGLGPAEPSGPGFAAPKMQAPPAASPGNAAVGVIKRGFVALASLIAIAVLVALVYHPMQTAAPAIDVLPGWHTNLAYTTCTEYQQSMTSAQRVAAAGYLLAIERRLEVSDASDGAEFAGVFAADIGAACTKYYSSTPTATVIAAATMAYMNDPSLHPVHH
jgi:hypothetical protein